MAKQTNQVNRELKRLEAKEIDPSLLYVRELRGRNINEESYTHPIRQPSLGPTSMHSAIQNPKPLLTFHPYKSEYPNVK